MNLRHALAPVAGLSLLLLLSACGGDTSSETEGAGAASPSSGEGRSAETADQKISYVIGYQTAERFVNDPVLQLDDELLVQGVRDAIANRESAVSQADAMAANEELQQRLQVEQSAAAEQAQAAGQTFLESNRNEPGVMTTASGLQYKVLEEGDSEQSPGASDTVTVHYHGTLTGGEVFDSSVDRGEPATFPLGNVIPGWTEGVQLMSVGDKYRFFIPSQLAYGPRAVGSIPPNSVLIFDIELLSIQE